MTPIKASEQLGPGVKQSLGIYGHFVHSECLSKVGNFKYQKSVYMNNFGNLFIWTNTLCFTF